MSHYPAAIDSALVGTYPAHTKSGGGYFYDDVLDYRVWCRPWQGAPDEFDGEIYYYAFVTYEQAKAFSDATAGSEQPLVLVRQREWIDEPVSNQFIHKRGERLTEWLVEWLLDGKREEQSIELFMRQGGGL